MHSNSRSARPQSPFTWPGFYAYDIMWSELGARALYQLNTSHPIGSSAWAAGFMAEACALTGGFAHELLS